jgi:hypothetical protein
VNQQTGEVIADGAVRLQRDGKSWRAEHLHYNFKSQTSKEPSAPAQTSTNALLPGAKAMASNLSGVNSPLVQDGKLLFEAGKLDQAETKLRQAIKEEPRNQAAYYYLNLVNETRYKVELLRLGSETDIQPIPLAPSPGNGLSPPANPHARTNLVHVSTPQLHLKAKFVELSEAESKRFWEKFAPTNIASASTRTAIVLDQQMKNQLKEWALNPGVDLLNEFSVTTLSGRQVQMEATTPPINLTLKSPSHLKVLDIRSAAGPTLDVFSTVSEDGYSIQLQLTASTQQFLGYGDGRRTDTRLDSKGDTVEVTAGSDRPVPLFQRRTLTTEATVGDGQTLVMGNPVGPRGKPMENAGDGKKRLLVLLTPTMIDSAGNRIHNQNEKPPQKAK